MRIEGSGPPYLVDIGRTAPAGSVAATTPVQGAAQTPAAAKPASPAAAKPARPTAKPAVRPVAKPAPHKPKSPEKPVNEDLDSPFPN